MSKKIGDAQFETLLTGHREHTHRGKGVTPVRCGAAFRNRGIQPLLDGIVDLLPSPLDIPAIRGPSMLSSAV